MFAAPESIVPRLIVIIQGRCDFLMQILQLINKAVAQLFTILHLHPVGAHDAPEAPHKRNGPQIASLRCYKAIACAVMDDRRVGKS